MALYTGRLLMRGGNEADFDADKMMPREWAVSTDKKIVRICVAPGVVIRMATYDAFEEDMAKIENILKECQTIQEVVVRINTEVSKNADAVAEYTSQAKTYMESAKVSATNAKTSETNAKTSEVNAKASETNAKVSEEKAQAVFESLPEDYGTLSKEFYEVAIKQKASGENIHVTDSANAKVREFALFGKAKQETTSGKNLLEYPYRSTTTHINGIDWVDNRDGTITGNGTCTKIESLFNFFENSNAIPQYIQKGILYTCSIGGTSTSVNMEIFEYVDDKWVKIVTTKTKANFSISDNATGLIIRLQVYQIGTIVNNVTVYPMIRLASITDDTYEPYTNGASPNPDYPQEIEVSGESYNLLPYPYEETVFERNGVVISINNDGIITGNGVSTQETAFTLANELILKNGKYILSGRCNELVFARIYGHNGTTWINVADTRNANNVIFSADDTVYSKYLIHMVILNGATLTNDIFYPMIRKASVKNDRYMPYGKGSVEVKSVGKNLLKYPYSYTTKTIDGITFTVNSDGSVTINGTSTSAIWFIFRDANTGINLKGGKKYKISGCPSGGGSDKYFLYLAGLENYLRDYGEGFTYTPSVDEIRSVAFVIYKNQTFNNVTMYPMIRYAEIGDDTYNPYREPILATIPTENGLAGIKVDSGGNYTDSNGQQWICDEVVKYADGSGKRIQRIGKTEFKDANFYMNVAGSFYTGKDATKYIPDSFGLCTNVLSNSYTNPTTIFVNANGVIRLNIESDNVETTKTLMENAIFYGILAEEVHTPLTAEEIAEIEKLHTFYPVTNISNDFDCGMKITYNCDSKNYIDKHLAEMERAREQAMMNMFLLLPEETQATMIENDVNNLLTESEN